MARPSTVVLLALLTLAAAAPLSAGAGLPAPAGTTERVTSYYFMQEGAWPPCQSYEPTLSLFSLALPSYVTTTPAPGGSQYAFHLESLASEPGCPIVDLSFASPLAAWPTEPTGAGFSSPCGATGWLYVYPYPQGYSVQMGGNVPDACDAGVVGNVVLYAGVQPLHPSPYIACAPAEVILTPCLGASEGQERRYTCPNGQRPAWTDVALVLNVYRTCDWSTGEDVVFVSPVLGFAWIEARRDSCVVRVQEWALGSVDESVPCPDGVGPALYEADWGNMLP